MSNEYKDWLRDELEDKMLELISILNINTKMYDQGNPVMSDKKWDELYFKLKDLEEEAGYALPNSPTQVINYEVVSELKKIPHDIPMLSLDKTKDMSQFINYFKTGKDVIGMLKLDGLTCRLRYKDGVLIEASTRGTGGLVGEDILHNAKIMPDIPNHIPYKEDLIIDGEVICNEKIFKENFSEEYANARNFAAGSIRLLDAKECAKRKLNFIAWNIVSGFEDDNSFLSKLHKIEKLGFNVVPYTSSLDWDWDEFLKNKAKELGYPIDGLVGRYDDVAYGRSLGATGHHSRAAYAFKFYDETYPTMLIGVEWTMGRTGVLTPVALLNPIEIEGSIVERASLHNISIMEDLFPAEWRTGYTAYVYKANMIIPQIERLEHEEDTCAKRILIPKKCPICGGDTEVIVSDSGVKNLVCVNPNCEGKLINKLDHFAGKKGLDIKGLSVATLEKLIDWGWVENITDIFCLEVYEQDWKRKPGFGKRSVENILSAIKQSQKCELHSFICALGIPLIGSTYAKELAKYYKTWDDFKTAIDKKFHFDNLDGFGPEMCLSLWKFNYKEADLLAQGFEIKNSLWKDPNETITTDLSLTGMTIVITGKLVEFKNRAALQGAIEAAGGKVVGSVSKNTNILINNDATSTSSKNLSAQKLGIPIMTELEFKEKFLDK